MLIFEFEDVAIIVLIPGSQVGTEPGHERTIVEEVKLMSAKVESDYIMRLDMRTSPTV